MPSLVRLERFTIYVYADDHAPPHFHVVGRGFKATIRIGDLGLDRGKLPPGIYAEAVAWAAANLETLTLAWETNNARD
ncbi:DUF4160 domain-containing protein [Methylobacterium sp. D54C]